MTAIWTPSLASAWQMRCPSPPLPPVTTATAPLRSIAVLPSASTHRRSALSRAVCDLRPATDKRNADWAPPLPLRPVQPDRIAAVPVPRRLAHLVEDAHAGLRRLGHLDNSAGVAFVEE